MFASSLSVKVGGDSAIMKRHTNIQEGYTSERIIGWKFNGGLNSSPVDKCGEGACKVCGGAASMRKRVTMTTLWAATTQVTSHWILSGILNTYQYLPRGRGGTGAKLFPVIVHAAQHEQNGWRQQGSCKFTEAPQNPRAAPPKLRKWTAGQHWLQFNLA